MLYHSVRLVNDLMGHCTKMFKGRARYDRVSIESVRARKRAGVGGYVGFGEIHALAAIIWPSKTEKPREKLTIVRYFEEVSVVQDWIKENIHFERTHSFYQDLQDKYVLNFDRINPRLFPLLTDGNTRLGRPYLMYQPDKMCSTGSFGILDLETLWKPEHLLHDRELMDDSESITPNFYVQNTYTYFSNVSLKS